MCNEYNGWPNYQTWDVYLWLTNDQASDTLARQLVADALRDLIADCNPLADHASLYSDLLTHALGAVDWHHLADHLREG
jgi:hypothetical protein